MRHIAHLLLLNIIVLLSALFGLISCTQHKDGWKSSIQVVDGVTLVKNPDSPLNPELKIIFEEDLTIGVKGGDENYMFGSQVFLTTDEEGSFYVTDGDRKVVKKYDVNGRFLQSIGRPGQGPGEFQTISAARFDGKGNIYLNDVSNQRISFLSREGRYLKGIRVPFLLEGVVINSKGLHIGRSADNVRLGKGKRWDYFYGLFDDRFNLAAEFLRLPQEAQVFKNFGSAAQVFADYLSSMAFTPSVNYVLDQNDLLYFGYSQDYEIKVFSSEGKLLKRIQRDFKPVEIDKRHKEYFVQNLSEQTLAKMPPGEEEEVFELIRYPKYLPAYERFTLMENGWIFVVVDSVRVEYKLVDIFNREGEYLAQFETDIPTDWLSFNNGKAYSVATKDDYKFIKRYNFDILGYTGN